MGIARAQEDAKRKCAHELSRRLNHRRRQNEITKLQPCNPQAFVEKRSGLDGGWSRDESRCLPRIDQEQGPLKSTTLFWASSVIKKTLKNAMVKKAVSVVSIDLISASSCPREARKASRGHLLAIPAICLCPRGVSMKLIWWLGIPFLIAFHHLGFWKMGLRFVGVARSSGALKFRCLRFWSLRLRDSLSSWFASPCYPSASTFHQSICA